MRTIRLLDRSEVARLVAWAADEGWNPGTDDAAAFFDSDPEGFLGAFVDGEMVAGISAVRYGSAFGFIGLYIVRPQQRGKGHGKALWDAAIASLAGRTVGLDGVPAQQANYARMGFVVAHETIRLSGVPVLPTETIEVREGVAPADIEAFDRACFPSTRSRFLRTWFQGPRRVLASFADGDLRGYGVVRPCRSGHKVGPLFAMSTDVAIGLFAALARRAGGDIQIDVPVAQREFIDVLLSSGMTPGFATARMYRGIPPTLREGRVFGITTLELG